MPYKSDATSAIENQESLTRHNSKEAMKDLMPIRINSNNLKNMFVLDTEYPNYATVKGANSYVPLQKQFRSERRDQASNCSLSKIGRLDISHSPNIEKLWHAKDPCNSSERENSKSILEGKVS